MDPLPTSTLARRALVFGAFVGSAAMVAAAVLVGVERPILAFVAVGLALGVSGARWVSRQRTRKLLHSGDVFSVLARFSRSADRVPHPATMGPLMTATAFAAYGWARAARTAIAAAERGPPWDAALEHRLFLDTLLLAYEGDREGAVENARRLVRLPPPASGSLRARALTLRLALGAFARAFAHQSERGDRELLVHASESSPLVFWAMRYAAAVVSIDEGDEPHARTLIEGAPAWPEESTFREFHREIAERASGRSA